MAIRRHYDELLVGDQQITRGRTITEADLVKFAETTGDFFALHVDAEYAKTTIFGERLAHGLMVFSYMVGQMNLQPGAVVAFYSIENLSFLKPVKIGDTIHGEIEITALEPRGKEYVLSHNQFEIKNQRDEVVVKGLFKWLLPKKPEAVSE
jgi:3-hydroxybutyryl-CoA dehydratase